MPLRPRPQPPRGARRWSEPTGAEAEGTFFLQNVLRRAGRRCRQEPIKRLRIVQVLPKSTPHANDPTVGLANASPGKQVLGTVPVEADGSAYFRAPAGIPLAFQALDERGQAVQMMRSLTYLQPGENGSAASAATSRAPRRRARRRDAAGARPARRRPITPGPDGSKPFSYPILVQPVLDKQCVACHNAGEAGRQRRPDRRAAGRGTPRRTTPWPRGCPTPPGRRRFRRPTASRSPCPTASAPAAAG